MKKICLLLLALVAAVGVQAASTWYLVGNAIGNGNVWTDQAQFKFTPSESDANIQTLSITKLEGEIKIKKAGSWSGSFGTNGQKLKEGVTYNAGNDGANIVVDGTINDATITINETAHTVLVTGAAAENDYTEVYLVGDINGGGWKENITNFPLTLKEGTTNVYEGKYTLTAANNYFKMKAGALVYGTGGNDIAVILGKEYTAAQSGNAFSITAGEYIFSFVLDKNADTGKLTVTSESGEVNYPETMNIIGYVNGSGFSPSNYIAMTPVEGQDGVFSATEVEIGESAGFGYFSFATNTGTDWADLNPRYGAPANDYVPTLGEPCGIQGGENAFKITPGKYDMLINFAEMTLTVTASQVVDPLPETLYIYGNVNGDTWNPANNYAMTKTADGVFTATEVAIGEELGSGYGYFSFAVNAGEDGNWSSLGKRYGATVNDFEPTSGVAFEIARGENAIKVIPGNYNITVNLAEMNATIEYVEPAPEAKDYTYDFLNQTYGMTLYSNGNDSGYNPNPYVLTDGCDDLVVTLAGGNNRLWDTDGLRFYKQSYMTIALPEGAPGVITKIEYTLKNNLSSNFVLSAPAGATLSTPDANNAKLAVWEGEATAVTINYNKTSSNQAISSVKVYYTTSEPQPVNAPETLVLMGKVNGMDWNPAEGVEMTKDGNSFSADGVTIDGTFSFATALAASWDELNTQTRWGADADDVVLDVNPGNTTEAYLTAYEGYAASGCKSFSVEKGKYNVTVNFTARGTILKLKMLERIVDPNFVKVSEVKSGNTYVFYHDANYNVDFAAQIGTGTYGYMKVTPVECENGDEFYGNVENGLTFTEVEGGWNIALANGTKLSNQSGYKTISTNQTDSELWTVSVAENGEATITNVTTGGVIYLDGQYNSFGCYTTATVPTEAYLPVLYGLISEQGEEPEVETPDVLYIIGNINGTSWNTNEVVEMSKSGNTFSAKNVTINDANEGYGYFSFITKKGANWDEVNGSDRYGAAYNDQPIAAGDTVELALYAVNVNASAACSFKVTAGLYNFAITFVADGAPLLSITKASDSIEAVEINEAEVEYYNLQGVRVVNPENGLYIRRQGNNVSKVFVK